MRLLLMVFLSVMFSVIDGNNETECTGDCLLFDLRGPVRRPSDLTNPNLAESLMKSNKAPNEVNNFKPCGGRNVDGVGYRSRRRRRRRLLHGVDRGFQTTYFGEFPWMVVIFQEQNVEGNSSLKRLYYLCGASLIHPEVVLTSAQCVEREQEPLRIRVGEWDLESQSEFFEHQDRGVKSVIIHPDFKKQGLHNNVALLILDSPLELVDAINTVCLPSQDEVLEDQTCLATGWGKNSFDKDSEYPFLLKKVELPTVQQDACQEQLRKTKLGKDFILDKSFICAGGELGEDTCAGDGGGPLVCPIPGKKGKYHQRGLVSWGIGCGNEVPGVYSNVADFRNWIDNEMVKLNFDTSTYTA